MRLRLQAIGTGLVSRCTVAVLALLATLLLPPTTARAANPPTLSMSFGADSIPVGGSTNLGFVIANPNGATFLTGIGFTDSLPAGLVVSTPNGLSSSCNVPVSAA